MLYDPDRHEPLHPSALDGWNEARARACITAIVRDTEMQFSPQRGWPSHPLDTEPGDGLQASNPSLYYGSCGVLWALQYLSRVGAAELERDGSIDAAALVQGTREWLNGDAERAAFLMGETPVRLLEHAQTGSATAADRLAVLIEGNMGHPARELMWGAPGTMLAALFMHESTGQERFAELFRRTAATLWSQLEWSSAFGCRYWTQRLYGEVSAYMDAVHGFAGTALPLIRGRHLLTADDGARWLECISTSMRQSSTASSESDRTASRASPSGKSRAWQRPEPAAATAHPPCARKASAKRSRCHRCRGTGSSPSSAARRPRSSRRRRAVVHRARDQGSHSG